MQWKFEFQAYNLPRPIVSSEQLLRRIRVLQKKFKFFFPISTIRAVLISKTWVYREFRSNEKAKGKEKKRENMKIISTLQIRFKKNWIR